MQREGGPKLPDLVCVLGVQELKICIFVLDFPHSFLQLLDLAIHRILPPHQFHVQLVDLQVAKSAIVSERWLTPLPALDAALNAELAGISMVLHWRRFSTRRDPAKEP